MRVSVAAALLLLALSAISRADELADVIRVCGKPVSVIDEPNQGRRLWRRIVFEPVLGKQVTARFFALAVNDDWYYESDVEALVAVCRQYKENPPVQGVAGKPFQDASGTWRREVVFDCPKAEKHFFQSAPAKDGPWTWDTPGMTGDILDCPAPEGGEQAKECPHGIRAGMSRNQVFACLGAPDHINSDLYTDQFVYPNDIYVYINRATDKVENVQWTH